MSDPHRPEGLDPERLLAAGLTPDADAKARDAAEIADHFPKLEILGLVGEGGMGVVYKARQPGLDRLVALKVLPPREDLDAGFAARFTREARALARLDHPNIVRVHEFGESDGLYYLVMEFVEGVTLRDVIRDGEMAPAQALSIVPQICDALQYAHDKGVVHRDIKPENVLVGVDGSVKIADFGLAKIVGAVDDRTLTRVGQVMGTLHYMAPEQIESPSDVDHRADIYSLGVVFYEMLTGELPLGRFDPPSERVQVDVRLDEVVLRALAKRRDRRYQRADAVKSRVSEIVDDPRPADGEPPAPAPSPAAGPDGSRESRSDRGTRLALLALPAAFALILAGIPLALAFPRMHTQIWMTVFLLAALTGIGAFVGGVLAWVRAAGRPGKEGRGLAIAATVLPWVLVPVASVCGTLAEQETRPGRKERPIHFSGSGWTVSGLRAAFGGENGELVARDLRALTDRALSHILVGGGVEGLDGLYREADLETIRGYDPEELAKLRAGARLGLPLVLESWLPEPPATLSARGHGKVTMADDGASARVVLDARESSLVFEVVREQGAWRFALGPVLKQIRTLPVFVGTTPPHEVVSGGPPMKTADRDAVAAELMALMDRGIDFAISEIEMAEVDPAAAADLYVPGELARLLSFTPTRRQRLRYELRGGLPHIQVATIDDPPEAKISDYRKDPFVELSDDGLRAYVRVHAADRFLAFHAEKTDAGWRFTARPVEQGVVPDARRIGPVRGARVRGGPPLTESGRRALVEEILELMDRGLDHMVAERELNGIEELYPAADVERLRTLTEDEFSLFSQAARIGLPLLYSVLADRASSYRRDLLIERTADGTGATVTAHSAERYVTFQVVREDGAWRFAARPVEEGALSVGERQR